jgi:hypothetical protein
MLRSGADRALNLQSNKTWCGEFFMAEESLDVESRRRYPRLEFGIRVFEEKDWMIRDLNPLGCFIETATPLAVDTEVNLQFQIPLESEYLPIVAKGVVRRSEPDGMAIEFTEMQPVYYAYLEKFVETYY